MQDAESRHDSPEMTCLIDPVLLRTLAAVVRSRSFSRAAEQLGLGQSTVSQHVQRLEAQVGRRLVARDTHSVALTPEGETVLGFARTVLDAHERLERALAGGPVRGKVRFGASEDFVQSRLSEVLRDFREAYPSVDLELSVALTGFLHDALARGELDLVLGKRHVGETQGMLVRRDRLVWVGLPTALPERGEPVALASFHPFRLEDDSDERPGRDDPHRTRGSGLPAPRLTFEEPHGRAEPRPDEPRGLLPELPVELAEGFRRRARAGRLQGKHADPRLRHALRGVEAEAPDRSQSRAAGALLLQPSRRPLTGAPSSTSG